MSRALIARYLTPWTYRRQQEAQRVTELRGRDGDECRRCRRPIRFDLTPGHDKGPKIERSSNEAVNEEDLAGLFLCHGRCNTAGADSTDEVAERVRRRSEAALFARPAVRSAAR